MLLWFEYSAQQLIEIGLHKENTSASSNAPSGTGEADLVLRDLPEATDLVRDLPEATRVLARGLIATIKNRDAVAKRIASALVRVVSTMPQTRHALTPAE